MAIVYSPNVIEIAVNQTHSGRPSVNVWHMWFDSELGTDTKEAVVRDFANNWQDHIMTMCTGDQALIGFDWRSLDPTDATLGSIDPDLTKNINGTTPGATMPPNVAFLIKKDTLDRPRGRRDGRCFLSGVAEQDMSSAGEVSTSRRAALQAALDSFYNGISDTSGAASGDRYPVVLETTAASRAPGTASVTINSRRVTSLTLDFVGSTQRDRLR